MCVAVAEGCDEVNWKKSNFPLCTLPLQPHASNAACINKPEERNFFQLIIEDGDEDIGNMKQHHKSSFIAVTFNFVNSIIGSGIIGKLSRFNLIFLLGKRPRYSVNGKAFRQQGLACTVNDVVME